MAEYDVAGVQDDRPVSILIRPEQMLTAHEEYSEKKKKQKHYELDLSGQAHSASAPKEYPESTEEQSYELARKHQLADAQDN